VIPLDQSFELDQARVHVPVWAWLVVALAVTLVYAIAIENGPVLSAGANTIHELFHDGRHFLGVPCH
jgi:putative cobalt transporter subunit CbtB